MAKLAEGDGPQEPNRILFHLFAPLLSFTLHEIVLARISYKATEEHQSKFRCKVLGCKTRTDVLSRNISEAMLQEVTIWRRGHGSKIHWRRTNI